MNCRSAEPLFSAFLEDELNQKERRSLESHLLSCRRCSVSVREIRATIELMQDIPFVETSPHFEADLLVRIRSGEGLRPTVVEWLRALLEPERLRPIFLTGALACAAWIAVLLVNSNGFFRDPGPIAQSKAPTAVLSGNEVASIGPSIAASPTGAVDTTPPRPNPARATDSRGTGIAAPVVPAQEQSMAETRHEPSIPNPGSRYVDEYITDQFYIERGIDDPGRSTITPVSDHPSDDVYIIF